MGKLVTTGYSRRTVEADRMEVSISIRMDDRYSDKAIEKSEKDTEGILKILESLGVDLSEVETNGQRITRDTQRLRNNSKSISFEYSRYLKFETGADLKLANRIISEMAKTKLDISVDVSYYASDSEEIQNGLKVEALRDARAKAEAMAEALGVELVGVYQAGDGFYHGFGRDVVMSCDEPIVPVSDTPLADQLSVRKDVKEERIEVVWIVGKNIR